jgi:hypothetical protein
MSYTPGPFWRQQEGEAAEKQESIDQARERRALLDRARADAPGSPGRGVVDRVRRMFSRGGAPPGPGEADLSEEQVWERERERRREYDQDRLNGGD